MHITRQANSVEFGLSNVSQLSIQFNEANLILLSYKQSSISHAACKYVRLAFNLFMNDVAWSVCDCDRFIELSEIHLSSLREVYSRPLKSAHHTLYIECFVISIVAHNIHLMHVGNMNHQYILLSLSC